MPDAVKHFGSISVVVPAYNAEQTVGATLDDVQSWLEGAGLPHEIIVVDDGSTDDTAGVVESRGRGVRVIRVPRNRGKGYAVRTGMLSTTKAWAVFMDVDNSTRISHLERFAAAGENADVIIASRRMHGATIIRPQHPIRQLLGRTFPYIVRTLALRDIRDTQCGFKAFRSAAIRRVFPYQRIERFAFDVEVLLLARKQGLRIAEIPVDWDNPTDSTVRVHFDTVTMLADVLRAIWRLRGGAPLPAPIAIATDPQTAEPAADAGTPG